jgi:hypothetical protein
MPVMFCGYFNAYLWKMFAKLSYFHIKICAKQVSKVMMQSLDKENAVLVRKMETIFPPRWFNALQDLLCIYPGKLGLEYLCSSARCIVKKEN